MPDALTAEEIKSWRSWYWSDPMRIATQKSDPRAGINPLCDMALRSVELERERVGWIPVTERLPELVHLEPSVKCGNQMLKPFWKSDMVLVLRASGHAGLTELIAKEDKTAAVWYCYGTLVTHWMPLPAPPDRRTGLASPLWDRTERRKAPPAPALQGEAE